MFCTKLLNLIYKFHGQDVVAACEVVNCNGVEVQCQVSK